MYTFPDFFEGVVQEYLLECEVWLLNLEVQLLSPFLRPVDLEPYELERVNGYSRRRVRFTLQAPDFSEAVTGFTALAPEIAWDAKQGPLGGGSFNFAALVARANTPKNRLVYLDPLNLQNVPGFPEPVPALLSIQEGNSLAYTPKLFVSST